MSQKPATHCKGCGIELTEINKVYLAGRQKNRCRTCYNERQKVWRLNNPESKSTTRRNTTLKVYGMTTEEYELMLNLQDNVCAICKEPESIQGRSLAVDHCHNSNIVRGLLCHRCNVVLGMLDEDEELIYKMLEYLRDYNLKFKFKRVSAS